MVRIWWHNAIDSLSRPHFSAGNKTSFGYITLPGFREAIGTTLTMFNRSLISSSLTIKTGLDLPCSDPMTGSRSALQMLHLQNFMIIHYRNYQSQIKCQRYRQGKEDLLMPFLTLQFSLTCSHQYLQ